MMDTEIQTGFQKFEGHKAFFDETHTGKNEVRKHGKSGISKCLDKNSKMSENQYLFILLQNFQGSRL